MVLKQLEKIKKMPKFKAILDLGKHATRPFSKKAIAKIAANLAKSTSWAAKGVKVLKGGKRVPLVGAVVALLFLPSDIYNKGLAGGLLNSGLDALPFVGTGKGIIEIFTGDFIPDLENYDPELYDAEPYADPPPDPNQGLYTYF